MTLEDRIHQAVRERNASFLAALSTDVLGAYGLRMDQILAREEKRLAQLAELRAKRRAEREAEGGTARVYHRLAMSPEEKAAH